MLHTSRHDTTLHSHPSEICHCDGVGRFFKLYDNVPTSLQCAIVLTLFLLLIACSMCLTLPAPEPFYTRFFRGLVLPAPLLLSIWEPVLTQCTHSSSTSCSISRAIFLNSFTFSRQVFSLSHAPFFLLVVLSGFLRTATTPFANNSGFSYIFLFQLHSLVQHLASSSSILLALQPDFFRLVFFFNFFVLQLFL